MIEINLIEKKKPLVVPVVAGIDLRAVNFKFWLIAIVFYYIPPMLVSDHFQEQHVGLDEQISSLSGQENKLKNEVGKNSDVGKELVAYNNRVNQLKQRSELVDRILKEKTNPKKLFEKIARSIPEDMWFDELSIDRDRQLIVKGASFNYKSIGDFVTMLSDSAFFGGDLTISSSKTEDANIDGINARIESYEIKGRIKTFDLWAK